MTAPACGWVRAIDDSTVWLGERDACGWVRAIDDSTCMWLGESYR